MRENILVLGLVALLLLACTPQKGVDEQVIVQDEENDERTVGGLDVSSSAFSDGGYIPSKYTCDGLDVNPTLRIEMLPEGTESLAVIVDDPDAPGETWNHWVVWNIDPINVIPEDSNPGIQGLNDFGKHSYGGPCPPSGVHTYHFKVYALDTKIDINQNAKKENLEKAMENHIIAQGQITGTYSQ